MLIRLKQEWPNRARQNRVIDLLPEVLDAEKINENKIHETVNDLVSRDLLTKKRFYMDRFEKRWKKGIIRPETRSFLELAGGLCYISALVKLHRPDIEVWATDVAPLYLERKSVVTAQLFGVQVDQFAAIDAENLPFEDNQFDAVFIAHSIHHIGNIERMLQEVHRVLAPGGRFLGIDIAAPSNRKAFDADLKDRAGRGDEHGIHEKSISFAGWADIVRVSGVPDVALVYENTPSWAIAVRKLQNVKRRRSIAIHFDKRA
jgi:SAM-dependent methyltransferase